MSEANARAHDRADDAMSVTEIQEWRAKTDDLVFPGDTNGYESFVPEHHHDRVVAKRLERVADADGDYIEKATWGEVVAFCMAGSGNAGLALSDEFMGIYLLAFNEHVAWADDTTDLPDSLVSAKDTYITDRVREKAADLRRRIKQTQDKAFIEVGGGYDDLPLEPQPPKAFWRKHV